MEEVTHGGSQKPPQEELPENGPTVASGTQVKKPSDKNWDESKINSYSDGAENTIPVPVGFTPMPVTENGKATGQGTKDTGFVIRDTSVDVNGQPSETYGNEFVWIPCTMDGAGESVKYNRYAFTRTDWNYKQTEKGTDAGTNSEKIEVTYGSSTYYYTEARSSDEQTSVTTYGGYYIGRYESGISKGSARTANNESQTAEQIEAVSGKAIIQENKDTYNWITRDQAKGLAERVYPGKSKLCSSYGWDTALKFIDGETGTYAVNSTGGNYSGNGGLKKTGYHGIKNIYDMGGNVYEWTTETFSDGSSPCTARGGDYYYSASSIPAANRNYLTTTVANDNVGFRVTLYM